MFSFLWPYAPGLWKCAAVTLASLSSAVVVRWFVNDFLEVRAAATRYYACGIVPAPLLACYWASPRQ